MPLSMMNQALTISLLIEHANKYHGSTPIVSVDTNRKVSHTNWSTIRNNAKKLASSLNNIGLKQGDRVATIAWNNSRHLELYFGVAGNGMVCHTINPRLFPEQLSYIISHAEDKVLFVDETFVPLVEKLISNFSEQLRSVDTVVVMSQRHTESEKAIEILARTAKQQVLFYDELLDEGDDRHDWPSIDENLPSSLCYTSGTTGNPKGVLFTHRTTVLHSIGGNQPDGVNISATDTVMPVVPMFHVNAWGIPYIAALAGCKLVLPGPGLDGQSLITLINNEAVTLALGVPTIWQGLLTALRESSSQLPSLKRTIVGGSALPPSMIEAFKEHYDVELIHAWGMTETSPIGTVNQLTQKHLSLSSEEQTSIRHGQGRPLFGVDLRIVDDNGAVLPNDGNTQGILQVKGLWVVDTYHQSQESALTQDGWFDTGDIATLDNDGYMVIRDRAKDIIKSGGEWISTVELENIAIAHPAVASAAVVAARHDKWDERPVLVVVPAESSTVDESELISFYDDKVASWQKPDKVIIVESMPLGGTGKVLKSVLREQYGNVLLDA